MWRPFSIVIFSLFVSVAEAQVAVTLERATLSGFPGWRVNGSGLGTGTFVLDFYRDGVYDGQSSFTTSQGDWVRNYAVSGSPGMQWYVRVRKYELVGSVFQYVVKGNTGVYDWATGEMISGGTWDPPEFEMTEEYSFEFGPEYEGVRVVLRDQDGTIISEHVVPDIGLSIQGSYTVTKDERFELQIFADLYRQTGFDQEGLPVWSELPGATLQIGGDLPTGSASWNEVGPVTEAGTTFTRDGETWVSNGDGSYTVTGSSGFLEAAQSTQTFGDEFGAGAWTVRNEQGGIIASGSIPSGGGQVSWSGYVFPGESVTWEAQPLVVGSDDVPSLGSPVSLGPGSPLVVSGPSAPPVVSDPSPVPTPVPLPSPMPSPSPVSFPSDAVNGDQEVVDLEEDNTNYMDLDDGEEQVLAEAQGLAETWKAIFDKLYEINEVFGRITDKWSRASTVTPQAVSKQCVFAFGDAQVDLNGFGRYRFATGAMAWFFGAVAFHGLIRGAMRK